MCPNTNHKESTRNSDPSRREQNALNRAESEGMGRPETPRRDTRDARPDAHDGANQGEGDKRSARRYNRRVRNAVKNNHLENAAKAARKAIDGDEGPELREAERRGKRGNPPRHN